MKTIITNKSLFFIDKKTFKTSMLRSLSLWYTLFLMVYSINAQVIYHDITPDLSGSTLKETIMGQEFQWDMKNGNRPTYSASLIDSLIMVEPGQVKKLYRLTKGDTISVSSAWDLSSTIDSNATVVSVNKYLGFRVGTLGNYRYGWFNINVNSNSSEWVIKSYAYENTLNKFIIAGDTGISDGDTNKLVTAITVEGEGGVSAITEGDMLQMIAMVTPTNATNREVSWSVENGTGTATIDLTGMLTAQSRGTVLIKATAQDGSGTSGTATIDIDGKTSSIANVHTLLSYCYPNPAKEKLTLQFDKEESIQDITIRNSIGQTVYSSVRTVKGTAVNILTDFLPNGIYILTYQNTTGRAGVQKFMKIN